jgi:tetratricopeptide (TPR) repeat protein
MEQLDIARKISDRVGEGSALGNLGTAHFDLADYLRAVEYFERKLIVAKQLGDRRGEAGALADLGRTCMALTEPHLAIAFFDTAIRVAHAMGDVRLEVAILAGQGNARTNLLQHGIAMDFYRRSADVSRRLGDRRSEGNSLLAMGRAHRELGEPDQAIEMYHRALDIAADTGDVRFRAAAVDAMSLAMHDLCDGKYLDKEQKREGPLSEQWRTRMRDAIAMSERALELYEKTNDSQNISTLHSRIALYDRELYPFAILSSPIAMAFAILFYGLFFFFILIRRIWTSIRNQRSSLLPSLTIGGRTSSVALARPTPALLIQWIHPRLMRGLRWVGPRFVAKRN